MKYTRQTYLASDKIPNNRKAYLKKFGMDLWHADAPANNYSMIVIIPAIDEFENIQRLVNSLAAAYPPDCETLVIFVINNTVSADERVKSENLKTIEFLREIRKVGFDTGLVDASTAGNEMPDKPGGVGLARKIGMDLALGLFSGAEKHPQMVCLDADCTVAPNYFRAIREDTVEKKFNAGYIHFEHPIPGDVEEAFAIISYEIFMRYYVLALQIAGSPFGFHTVGSTIVVTPDAYVKVGGMNKKKAGEDFYFMEKLGKLYPIQKISGATVYPSPRDSWRVPFGTGQRVGRFLRRESEEYLLHDFKIISDLKEALRIYSDADAEDAERIISGVTEINPLIAEFFVQNGFLAQFPKIVLNAKTAEQLNRQKTNWLDGFRTMKLIHFLRDEQYPDKPMFDVLDEVFRKMGIDPVPNRTKLIPKLSVQKEYLRILRQIA